MTISLFQELLQDIVLFASPDFVKTVTVTDRLFLAESIVKAYPGVWYIRQKLIANPEVFFEIILEFMINEFKKDHSNHSSTVFGLLVLIKDSMGSAALKQAISKLDYDNIAAPLLKEYIRVYG